MDANATEDFWWGKYKGHDVATFRSHDCWYAYVDLTMIANMRFANATDAMTWLQSHVDSVVRRACAHTLRAH